MNSKSFEEKKKILKNKKSILVRFKKMFREQNEQCAEVSDTHLNTAGTFFTTSKSRSRGGTAGRSQSKYPRRERVESHRGERSDDLLRLRSNTGSESNSRGTSSAKSRTGESRSRSMGMSSRKNTRVSHPTPSAIVKAERRDPDPARQRSKPLEKVDWDLVPPDDDLPVYKRVWHWICFKFAWARMWICSLFGSSLR